MALLRMAGVRPTRQRLWLAGMLFSGSHRHVTAEGVFAEARAQRAPISMSTAYNALHEFCRAGLLRQISVAGCRSYFDTDTSDHHHFYFEDEGRIADIPPGTISVQGIPDAPDRMTCTGVDVIIRVTRA